MNATATTVSPRGLLSLPKGNALFKNQRIGSFELHFVEDGELIKPKKADGYLCLKPRGDHAQTQHFVLVSEAPLPSKKDMVRVIEAFYSRSSDYKLSQLHLEPKAR